MWLPIVALFLAIAAIAVRLLALLLDIRFALKIRRSEARDPGSTHATGGHSPSVGVVAPCKGIDLNFENNIRAILRQDYPNFRVVFVTANESDPAFPVLSSLVKETTAHSRGLTSISLVTSSPSGLRAQKIDNQLRAIAELGESVDVYAFLDSDVCPHPDFLGHLVSGLSSPEVAVSTGYRWLVPRGGFWSIVASLWNCGSAALAVDERAGFAWGGAMAIHRDTFESIGVRDYWWSSVSDDLSLTAAVRHAGRGIEFVFDAIVASAEKYSFAETLEWTTRQVKLVRRYLARLWWVTFICYGFTNLAFLFGILAAVTAVVLGMSVPLGSWLTLAIIGIGLLEGLIMLSASGATLRRTTGLSTSLWHSVFVPVAAAIARVNCLLSLRTNEIAWRGVKYEILFQQWVLAKPLQR